MVGAGCTAVVAGRRQRAAPRSQVVSCAYDASKEIGACDPLLFWDPIGFCESGTKEDFDRRRAVELKHGRVCMVAALGMIWPDLFGRFDGYLSPSADLKFADMPGGIAAISKIPTEGLLQILVFAGVIETQLFKDKSFGGPGFADYGAEPGNFGDPLGVNMYNDEMRLKEINNGRFAMICVFGILAAEIATGKDAIQQFGF